MVVPMFGQTQMKVNVPFEFSVNNHVMPAGNYIVQRVNETAVLIRSVESRNVARVSLTEAAGGGTALKAPSLTFAKIGDQHYLASAWFAHDNIGRQFAPVKMKLAKTERETITAASN
jgi:hypothetical protein